MLTSSSSRIMPGTRPQPLCHAPVERETPVHTPGHSYDSVTLSAGASGESRFHMEMVSRLSQEVRTAVTTGDIQKIRQELSDGSYTVDPMSIAARMLFLGESYGVDGGRE